MRYFASSFKHVALTACLAAFPGSAALAAQGQSFPGVTCTCQKCGPNGGDVTGDCASVCKDKTVFSKGSEPHDYCKAALTPTPSNWLQAAINIAGLDAQILAEASGVPVPEIIKIMEAREPVEVDPETLKKLTHALEVTGGVEITEDGVRLMQKPLKTY